jgi:hypothetical protein
LTDNHEQISTKKKETHELLLRRDELIAEDVRRKAKELEALESELKDRIDKSGPIVDEDIGIRLTFERTAGGPVWDSAMLYAHVKPEHHHIITSTIDNASVQLLIKEHGYTTGELEPFCTRGVRRGPLIETRLPKGALA